MELSVGRRCCQLVRTGRMEAYQTSSHCNGAHICPTEMRTGPRSALAQRSRSRDIGARSFDLVFRLFLSACTAVLTRKLGTTLADLFVLRLFTVVCKMGIGGMAVEE